MKTILLSFRNMRRKTKQKERKTSATLMRTKRAMQIIRYAALDNEHTKTP